MWKLLTKLKDKPFEILQSKKFLIIKKYNSKIHKVNYQQKIQLTMELDKGTL
jgi:hypothetical protein